jgi:Protein of unknown function (DUF2971)
MRFSSVMLDKRINFFHLMARMKLKPPPRKLYKYRPFNVFTLRQLTDSEVYYSQPKTFNDPLDCHPSIEVDIDRLELERLLYEMLIHKHTEDETKRVIIDLRESATWPGDERENLSDDDVHKLFLVDEIRKQIDAELGKRGVLSLSEVWDSPLMWSHYADDHRGVCIEYDTTELDHSRIGAVDYRSPRSIKASDLVEGKIRHSIEAKRGALTKSTTLPSLLSGATKKSGVI